MHALNLGHFTFQCIVCFIAVGISSGLDAISVKGELPRQFGGSSGIPNLKILQPIAPGQPCTAEDGFLRALPYHRETVTSYRGEKRAPVEIRLGILQYGILTEKEVGTGEITIH